MCLDGCSAFTNNEGAVMPLRPPKGRNFDPSTMKEKLHPDPVVINLKAIRSRAKVERG